jgi:GAF domain-containing protein
MQLTRESQHAPDFSQQDEQTACLIPEQMGLILAHSNLRETLRQQAIRDSLTGLFNRRILEEALGREP